MEQPVFKMLELFTQNNDELFWPEVYSLFHELHYTEEEFKEAINEVESRGFIESIGFPEENKGVKFRITNGGKAALESEKNNRDENTIVRRLDIEKDIAERKLIDQQLELMAIQVETAKQQNILNPLMIDANKSILATNENIVETNRHTRQTNKILVRIFAVTAAFTLIGAIGSIGTLFKSDDKSELQHRIIAKDSTITDLQKKLGQNAVSTLANGKRTDSLLDDQKKAKK